MLREFAQREDRFQVVAFVLPTSAERRRIADFAPMKNLEVVFGDLTDAAAVERAVNGVDVVLHLGALVSPVADDYPERAHAINVGGARNIIEAVRRQPDPSRVRVIMSGSVAQTGDRNPPHHWGRMGDPIRVSHFDEYGQSKVVAEKLLVDSGLPKWVWLRQTGIFHPGLLSIRDPIALHCPFEGVLEWVSDTDSARLAVNLCDDHVPDEVWCDLHNIGGGESWRLTNWEFLSRIAAALGVPDARGWYERNWFATRNFHGQWYLDSDRLEALVPFRKGTFDEALRGAVEASPRSMRLAGLVPAALIKHLIIKRLAHHPRGPLSWLRNADEARVTAFFGSREAWSRIGDWKSFVVPAPSRSPTRLEHGYDETVATDRWTLREMADAATFRGGSVVSTSMTPGDVASPLEWRCAEGHPFTASPRLILRAGHWCPSCVRDSAGYARQAERNPFLAQLELLGR